jgi:hypothetical protein
MSERRDTRSYLEAPPWKPAVILVGSVLLFSCEEMTVTSVDVASVTVVPAEATVASGDTLRLVATPMNPSGEPLPGWAIQWVSGDSTVATVDASGLVRAVGRGEVKVRAVFAGVEGTSEIRVPKVVIVDVERSRVIVDPASIAADGEGLSTVTIRLRDQDDEPIREGGHEVSVAQSGDGVLSSVTDRGDGTYRATLRAPTVTGASVLTVLVDGATLAETPTVTFVPGPASTATSTITADPVTLTVRSDDVSTITVRLRDAHGNLLTRGGDDVTLRASGRGRLSRVTDHGNGTYTATLSAPRSPGSATIRGQLNKKDIEDTATVQYTAAGASLDWRQSGRLAGSFRSGAGAGGR